MFTKSNTRMYLGGGACLKTVLRTERKFLLNELEVSKLKNNLDIALHRDSFSSKKGYQVRSLYFDSFDDVDYFEKLDSIEKRKKIRLRIYDPSDEYAFLEMKQKQGSAQLKRSLKISKDDALMMTEGRYSCLFKYDDPFALECYSLMQAHLYRPKVIVEYSRVPYVVKENSTRITLDSNIESTETNFNIFDEKLNMNPVMDLDKTVLEVKFNGFLLSYVQELLNDVDKSEVSVSKYMLARQHSMLPEPI